MEDSLAEEKILDIDECNALIDQMSTLLDQSASRTKSCTQQAQCVIEEKDFLSAKLSTLSRDNDNLRHQVAILETQNYSLELEIKRNLLHTENFDKVIKENDSLRKRMSVLEKQQDTKMAEVNDLLERIDAMHNEHNQEMFNLQRQIKELQTQNMRLRNTANDATIQNRLQEDLLREQQSKMDFLYICANILSFNLSMDLAPADAQDCVLSHLHGKMNEILSLNSIIAEKDEEVTELRSQMDEQNRTFKLKLQEVCDREFIVKEMYEKEKQAKEEIEQHRTELSHEIENLLQSGASGASSSGGRVLESCVICQQEMAVIRIFPCGHLCMCENCAEDFKGHRDSAKICPLCRNAVESYSVFTS